MACLGVNWKAHTEISLKKPCESRQCGKLAIPPPLTRGHILERKILKSTHCRKTFSIKRLLDRNPISIIHSEKASVGGPMLLRNLELTQEGNFSPQRTED